MPTEPIRGIPNHRGARTNPRSQADQYLSAEEAGALLEDNAVNAESGVTHMATDAIATLKTIRVTNVDPFPSPLEPHLEPYIWPVAIWIDNNTIAKPERVDVWAPAIGNARVVIKSEM